MDKKTTGIIATVATALLCGCPGACIIMFGAVSAAGYGTSEFNGYSSSIPTGAGIGMICLGLVFFLIPVAVAFFSFRTKKDATEEILEGEEVVDEDLPPAI